MSGRVQVLLDFSDPRQPEGPRWRHAFRDPQQVLQAQRLDQVPAVLSAAQAAAEAGRWCLGFVRYEAAPAFDRALPTQAADGPLAWFAVFDQPQPWPAPDQGEALPVQVNWAPPLDRARFDQALAALHQRIADGECYQVNFTATCHGQLVQTDPQLQVTVAEAGRALFDALQRAQPGGYAAWIDTGEEQWLSVSPELFFDWRDGVLLTRPMKGTAPRGRHPAEDAEREQALRASPKEQAENVMIVDLLRNDLSRIAVPHGVTVPALFRTQALPSVWQMTSDVEARTRADCTLADVFGALFPCGSVTGAPKVQAMKAIQALEVEPRGVYCGAIGVLRPGGAATFNVPIRTVGLSPDGRARCGIGSGITSGASAEGEWQEWQHKQAFLSRASLPFSLLETLRLQDGALCHGQRHLARLARAAAHFRVLWDEAHVQKVLAQQVQRHPTGRWRLRLLLDAQGLAHAEAFALEDSPPSVALQLAPRPFDEAHSEFTRFKTTRRAHYEAQALSSPGVYDTLLWNRDGELTECTRGNVACLLDGQWVTPALHCGLLDGVGREVALSEGWLREAVVRVEDLPRVQAMAFVNSLRGVIPARWLAAPTTP
ncbi:chorismate-binding protein [Curvibacter sp. HBC61]|uniref:Chorismate-binding protein n=1 Tax=Curvibacter cyanobacteriorum TaxID=3026422 RepID=A0ABT5N235_9BURK|nr:chorismate-binding protein [Curvibacter sp. HBC61]MDD0839649.1 chorismate-binding protein [Curvibacter sp. HBC61]